jgi:hypothetical protein
MKKLNSAEKFNQRAATGLNNQIHNSFYNAIFVNKTEQVVDAIFYAAKSVGAVSSFADIFKPDDAILIGKTNLSQAKMDANTVFLCTAIAIQHAAAGGTADSNVVGASYGLIPTYMRNGELSLKAGNRPIVDKLPMEVFHAYDSAIATGDTNAAAGTGVTYTMERLGSGVYELENPKWIYPNELISADLRFAAALTANDAVKILLIGAKNAAL